MKEFWVTPHEIGDSTGGKQHWAFTRRTELMGPNMIHCREVVDHKMNKTTEENIEEAAKEYCGHFCWNDPREEDVNDAFKVGYKLGIEECIRMLEWESKFTNIDHAIEWLKEKLLNNKDW